MKGFRLSSTGSTTQSRPRSRRSAGALHTGTADELVLVPPRQTLNAFSGNVEHQLDEGFRVVEHRLDDTAPPKSRRSAGALHPGTADELVLVPPRQTLNALPGNVEHQLDEGGLRFRRSAGALHTGGYARVRRWRSIFSNRRATSLISTGCSSSSLSCTMRSPL